MGRRTVTGMLSSSGQQRVDWSAAYRIFEHERFDANVLFATARNEVVAKLDDAEPLVVMMDDTLIRKRGRLVHGTAWRRDPLGPKFQTNFVWGQRFLQISAALPESTGPARCRGIPIDLLHCPTARKPTKKDPDSEWKKYKQLKEKLKISAVGIVRIRALREAIDSNSRDRNRPLIIATDGSYTNGTVCRNLPHHTTIVGRIRKDAKLFFPPDPSLELKRRRPTIYGKRMQTPDGIRQDSSIPWTPVCAWLAGQVHNFDVKTIDHVRWEGTGKRNIRLIVIRPLAYRLRKNARLLYRDPGYLLCTGPSLPLDRVLQAYIWRWEIELNFRDQKTLLGIGEAQVRTPAAVAAVPMFMTAAYSYLLLAGSRCKLTLPRPKWQRQKPTGRATTSSLIGNLRAQLWGDAMTGNKTGFILQNLHNTKPVLLSESLSSAVCYASR